MGQPHEIGQPQAVLASPIGGGGKHGQFAIGRRGKGEIARGLGEVDASPSCWRAPAWAARRCISGRSRGAP